MAKSETLTRREREIMDVLYARGRATAHEVLAALADPPSYSAVRTFLRLLEDKGHVRHIADGARYVYMPTVARSDARRAALAHVVKTFFDGSVESAVATLVNVSKNKLTNAELDRLSRLIDQAKKQGK